MQQLIFDIQLAVVDDVPVRVCQRQCDLRVLVLQETQLVQVRQSLIGWVRIAACTPST